MIFVTVGTHPLPFNRLFQEIDNLIENGTINERVIGQKGSTTYNPKNFECKAMMKIEEYSSNIKKARIVISHAGAGNIISALAENKPLIVVPRLKKYNEHTNDHQLDLARALKKNGICEIAEEAKELGQALKKQMKKKSVKREREFLAEKLRDYFLKASDN